MKTTNARATRALIAATVALAIAGMISPAFAKDDQHVGPCARQQPKKGLTT